jgi:hypothetical protein
LEEKGSATSFGVLEFEEGFGIEKIMAGEQVIESGELA